MRQPDGVRSGTVLTPLDDIAEHDGGRVGGKALNCALLRRAGFPVPDGLVLTADAPADAVAAALSHPWFASFGTGQLFAVRSSGIGEDSAGHSFAGIHETFLNVPRRQIPEAIRACLLSTSSDQARAYRETHGLVADATAAVLIQPMIDARVSGVAFTRHPVTGDDELVIDAAPGLGEALVSGRIEPDHYRLRKPDAAVVAETTVDGRAPLDRDLLRRLGELLMRRHSGCCNRAR